MRAIGLVALTLLVACAGRLVQTDVVPAGAVVVRAFWLADSLRPTGMIQVLAYEGTPTNRGKLLANLRVDSASSASLVGLPEGPTALRVASIGFYSQLIPVTVRSGCPDTVTVYMPLANDDIGPATSRPGRWRIDGCRSGA